MGNNHQLFGSLFKRDLHLPGTNEYLKSIVTKHPSFAAAQLYLLLQTPVYSNEYKAQAAKTAVLFNNNPLWLNYQVEEFANNESVVAPIETAVLIEENIDTANTEISHGLTRQGEVPPADLLTHADAMAPVDEPLEITGFNNAVVENESIPNEVSFGDVQPNKNMEVHGENENTVAAEWHFVEQPIHPVEETPVVEEIQTFDQNESLADNENNIGHTYNGTIESTGAAEIEQEDNKEIEPMHIKLNFTKDMQVTEDTVTFEPLHTSDYFASVGIKFIDEERPVDKLGKQLKSFTEWLKVMKKIHPDQLVANTVQADSIIQGMAEKSNTETDVVTEAMAEVLVQQGKARKAIDVYQKLSLLYPAKSTYFAAKIDGIKN